jgi:hypothetical protein
MFGPGISFPGTSGSASAGGGGGLPPTYVRDIIWVDLRQNPSGANGSEANPFNTANNGFGALQDGGTLMLAGGSAASEPGVTIAGRSGTFIGVSGQLGSGDLAPTLPTLTYAITSGTQRLNFRNISVALVHAGTAASLSSFFFEYCPSVTLTAGGDAPPVYCSGDRTCTFSGSGGPAQFKGITLGTYTANGSNAIEIDDCNVTGSQTSSTAITITGNCAFGASVSITAPTIKIDPVSHKRATDAGVTFSTTPTMLMGYGTPSDVGTVASAGTALTFLRSDAVMRLTFTTLAAVLAVASSAISVNSQRITGVAPPISGTDSANKDYVDARAVGYRPLAPVNAIAVSNQATRSGTAQTIDGVALNTVGMRVLLTGQTTASQNGVWVIQSGSWTRPTDFPTGGNAAGSSVLVLTGTTYGNSSWADNNTAGSDVIDTNSLTWVQTGGAFSISAGAGLTKTGSTLDVVANADGSIVVNADDIQVGVLATDAQHGNRGGGGIHALVTTSVAGFMSAADKTKLDGLPTSAPPTTRTLTAGAGLTGGGDLSADRTFDVVAADATITVNANSIQVGTIANANIRTAAALSVIGRSGNTSGTVADIAAPGDNTVLRVSGSVLGFGAVDLSTAQVTGVLPAANQASQTLVGDVGGTTAATVIGANKVTNSMLRTSGALSVLGRSANSIGNAADIAGANNQVLRISGSVLGFGAVDLSTAQVTGVLPTANQAAQTLTGDVGGTTAATVIGANKVVDSMLRTSGALSVIGRSANSTGNAADIPGTNNTVLRVSGSVLGFGAVDLATAQVTGVLPTANQAAQAHGSLTGLTNDDHTQYIRVDGTRAFTGDQSHGGHGITSVSTLSQNGTPATTGWLRAIGSAAGTQTILAIRGSTVDIGVLLSDASGNIQFGEGTNTPNANYIVKSGGVHTWYVAATAELALSATALDLKTNNVVNVGYLELNDATGTVSASGLIRTITGKVILTTYDGATISLLKYGVSAAHTFTVGDNNAVTEVEYRVATSGGVHSIVINNGLEYQYDATALTMNGNNLLMGAGFISFGASPSATGNVRATTGTTIIGVLDGSSIPILKYGVSAAHTMTLGDNSVVTEIESRVASGGVHSLVIANGLKLQLDANKLFLANTGTAPTTDPSSGVYGYAQGGGFKMRTPSGAVYTVAPVAGTVV